MNKQIKCSLILLLTALIWGMAFVAQSVGAEHIGAFSFTFVRNMIGTAVLLPVALISKEKSENNHMVLKAGIICGIALGIASCLQQYGLAFTTTGKAGFLTALYIIMTPVVLIFKTKKISPLILIAVIMALAGVYLLCITEELRFNKGDFYEFLCAVFFTAQILAVAHYSTRVNVYKLACLEFFTAGIVALIPMLFTETLAFSDIKAALIPLLYTGVFSSGVAYTLQIVGSKDLNPTVAALIMSLESCVAAIGGWIILDQSMSVKELSGCVIMFAAIILAQLPEDLFKRRPK